MIDVAVSRVLIHGGKRPAFHDSEPQFRFTDDDFGNYIRRLTAYGLLQLTPHDGIGRP